MKRKSSVKKFPLVVAFLFLFISASPVMACWCRVDAEELYPREGFKRAVIREASLADFVFLGTVVDLAEGRISFKVKKVWKGNFDGKITFVYPTDGFLDSCDYGFAKDESYVVFAFVSLEGFGASKCGKTAFI